MSRGPNPETILQNTILAEFGARKSMMNVEIFHMYVGAVWNQAAHCYQKTGPHHPRGMSDIVILATGGRTYFIEVKLPGEKQNPDQVSFQRNVERLGFTYDIAHSGHEGLEILRKYKILKDAI